MECLAFAKMTLASPEHARSHVIPIAVDLEVRTVQQEGEMIGEAMDRAIRTANMVPILWPLPGEIVQ